MSNIKQFLEHTNDKFFLAETDLFLDFQLKNGLGRDYLTAELIDKMKRKLENGDADDADIAYMKDRRERLLVKNALNDEDFTNTELLNVAFKYNPSPLVDACTVRHNYRLEVPILDYEAGEIVIKNTIDFSQVGIEKVFVDISEALVNESEDIVKGLISDEMNIKIEDKIFETLATTKLTATTLSAAYEKLGRKHKNKACLVMNHAAYAESDYKDKIKVITAPTSGVYLVDLNAIIVNYIIDKVAIDKNVRTGIYTFAANLYCLGSALMSADSCVKIG